MTIQHQFCALTLGRNVSSERIHRLLFAVVLLIAAWARLYALETMPPGMHYDLASKGVYALDILWNDARPFFIRVAGAPEPLMIYLQAASVWLLGPSITALRLVSALAGILSVALLYALAYQVTRDRRLALVAALALASSPELVHNTRMGLRFTLVPCIQAAVLWFFWRSWQSRTRCDSVWTGIFLGLGFYTYLSALLLPLVVLSLWLYQFWIKRLPWREHLSTIVWTLFMATLVALPRLVFQWQYPQMASLRASQVSILQNPALASSGLGMIILTRLVEYVKMFGIEWQTSAFARPLFDSFLCVIFLLGWGVCLWRWRHLEWFWAPLTLVMMLLPDLLAASEPALNRFRLIGIFVPTFFCVGVGACWILDQVRQRWRVWGYVALGVVLLGNAARGLGNYFILGAADLAPSEVTDFNVNRTDLLIAEWIVQQRMPVYLPLNTYARPPMHFGIGTRAPRLQGGCIEQIPEQAWMVLPRDLARPRTEGPVYSHDPWSFVLIQEDMVCLLPPTAPDLPTVETQLRARQPDTWIRDEQGEIIAWAYAVHSANNPLHPRPVTASAPIRFADGITLLAATLDTPRVQPGESIGVTLFWQATQRLRTSYAIFVHLLDVNEEVVLNADVLPALGAYPTDLWKPGDLIPTHHLLRVPRWVRAGKYRIEIGLYGELDHNRLNILDDQGNPRDTRVMVGSVKIASRQSPTYDPPYAQRANFGDVIALTGFSLEPTRTPRVFQLVLYWYARTHLERDYTVFVHVLDAAGNIVAQADHQPQDGHYPTSIWERGENVRDEVRLELPEHLPRGRYTIVVGWYNWETGARLPLYDVRSQPIGDALTLDLPLELK